MKQLIIGFFLAVLLVGCGEKPKFSISKSDNIESYADNLIFTKTEIDKDFLMIENTESVRSYKFINTPQLVLDDIQTMDLNVLGGYVVFNKSDPNMIFLALTMKGKATFNKLLDRVKESKNIKNFNCKNIGIEKGYHLMCLSPDRKSHMMIIYNPFADIVLFSFSQI